MQLMTQADTPVLTVVYSKLTVSVYTFNFAVIILQETKTFTMLEEVGMANKSTKTTQTSVRMAQHNERTRLHDLSCTLTNLCVH